jgi:hypothetical protein
MVLRLMLTALLVSMPPLWGADPVNVSVSPQTVTFRSTDPDATPVAAASTVSWTVWLGSGAWSLSVRANSPTLTNCPSVPVSAIRVRCVSVSVGGIPAGSGSCAQPFALSTTAQTVASGTQGRLVAGYNISLSYEFTDSWRYRGATAPPCSLTLTHSIYVQ